VTPGGITNALADWCLERAGEVVDPDVSFATSGLLDSFDVLELIVFAEKTFNTRFTTDDFARPEFGTLSGMASVQ
jgi:acyl carrier protein